MITVCTSAARWRTIAQIGPPLSLFRFLSRHVKIPDINKNRKTSHRRWIKTKIPWLVQIESLFYLKKEFRLVKTGFYIDWTGNRQTETCLNLTLFFILETIFTMYGSKKLSHCVWQKKKKSKFWHLSCAIILPPVKKLNTFLNIPQKIAIFILENRWKHFFSFFKF